MRCGATPPAGRDTRGEAAAAPRGMQGAPGGGPQGLEWQASGALFGGGVHVEEHGAPAAVAEEEDEAQWLPSQLLDEDDCAQMQGGGGARVEVGVTPPLPTAWWGAGIPAAHAVEAEGIWGHPVHAQSLLAPPAPPPPETAFDSGECGGTGNRGGGRQREGAVEVCRFFSSGKLCQRGVRCPFWHDPSLGVKPPLCRWTACGQPCPRGRRCPFAHEPRLASSDVERDDDFTSRRRGPGRTGRGRRPPKLQPLAAETPHPSARGAAPVPASASAHLPSPPPSSHLGRTRAVPLP